MYKQYILFVVSLIFIGFTDCLPPPPSLKICKTSDSKCMVETAKAFIPSFTGGLNEYNVQTLDPTKFKVIDASQGDLHFVLTDVNAVGLNNCEPKQIQRDLSKSKLHVKVLCSGQLDGQYVLKGNLLFVPLEGKGDIHVDLRSALVSIDLDLIDKQGEDGKNHWQIKSWSHAFELKGKSNVKFGGLFAENPVLGRATNELIANNGNDIVLEIGPPVVKILVARVVKNINNFFKAVPTEKLSLD